jgi:hypothetical protein
MQHELVGACKGTFRAVRENCSPDYSITYLQVHMHNTLTTDSHPPKLLQLPKPCSNEQNTQVRLIKITAAAPSKNYDNLQALPSNSS